MTRRSKLYIRLNKAILPTDPLYPLTFGTGPGGGEAEEPSSESSSGVANEPSRWQAGPGGYFPNLSSHKLRQMAAAGFGEMNEMQRRVAAMERTEPEDPTKPTPRVVFSLGDVTRGLGLDAATEQQVQRLVSDSNPSFTQKTQTQRIFHAKSRLLSTMRDSMVHVTAPAREEIVRRAMAYWKRHYQTDYGKQPTVMFIPPTAKSGSLVIPVDTLLKGSKHKYKRRWKGPDGRWRYEYDDKASGKGSKKGKEQLTLDLNRPDPKEGENESAKVEKPKEGSGPKAQSGEPLTPDSVGSDPIKWLHEQIRKMIANWFTGKFTASEAKQFAHALDQKGKQAGINATTIISAIAQERERFRQAGAPTVVTEEEETPKQWGEWTKEAIGQLSFDEAARLRNRAAEEASIDPEAREVMKRITTAHGVKVQARARELLREDSGETSGEIGEEAGGVAVYGEAPPGGWTEDDRVPPREVSDEEARHKAEQDAQREKNRRLRFEPGQKITVNGKQYEVISTPSDAPGVVNRPINLKPISGRAKKNRTLYISKQGYAFITPVGSTNREDVRSIEGGTKVDEPWEPTPKSKPEPEPTKTPPRPKHPPGSPRGEAERNFRDDVESGEYVNARKSAVGNAGEDLLGSARHKALEWKSLRQATRSSDADKLFTRKFLSSEEPINFVDAVQSGNAHPIVALLLQSASNKFPSKPDIFSWPVRGEDNTYHYKGEEFVLGGSESTGAEEVDKEEHIARQRAAYYDAYQRVKGSIERTLPSFSLENLESYDGIAKLVRGVRKELSEELRASEEKYGLYSSSREAIRKVYNAIGKQGKTSPIGKTVEFLRAAESAGILRDPEALQEKALDVLEGKSLNKAFGKKGESRTRTNDQILRENYNTDVMERKGPPSQFSTSEEALQMLTKHSSEEGGGESGRFGGGGEIGESVYGLRGVQWGNSVTDDERRHHAKSLVDSFNDLMDITGLPREMASFNGRLGMAIGARGKGGAMAHYEPDMMIINLTRNSGAGSLAHEWGHFFDYVAGAVAPGGSELTASQHADHPVNQAVRELHKSEGYQQFDSRIGRVLRQDDRMTHQKRQYWRQRNEMFARAFERHVQRKLHAAGRENTYLVGLAKSAGDPDGFWPTAEESDAMAPYFDRMFETFRSSDLLSKAIAYMNSFNRPGLYVPLQKGARGGKYYRRVPKPGGGYRYYYSKDAYDKAHADHGHKNGPEEAERRKQGFQKVMSRSVNTAFGRMPADASVAMTKQSNGNRRVELKMDVHFDPEKAKTPEGANKLKDKKTTSYTSVFWAKPNDQGGFDVYKDKSDKEPAVRVANERLLRKVVARRGMDALTGRKRQPQGDVSKSLLNPKYAHLVRPNFVISR